MVYIFENNIILMHYLAVIFHYTLYIDYYYPHFLLSVGSLVVWNYIATKNLNV